LSQELPNNSYARWVLLSLATLLVLVVLWNIRSMLLLALAAVILVIFISIPVSLLARFNLARVPAIILTLVVGVAAIYLMGLMVLPTIAAQFVTLATETVPRGVQEIGEFLSREELEERLPFLAEIDFSEEFQIDANMIRDIGEHLMTALTQVGGSVLPFVGGVANTLLSILIVIFLSLFFLADPKRYKNGFVRLFPLWYRHRVQHIQERLNYLLRRWLFGVMIGMLFTGLGTFAGLTLIGIREAAALAVLAALFSIVPNFGELLTVFFALVVGVVQAPDRLLLIVAIIYGVSLIQGQVVGPLVASETVNIPPVLILLGQIIVAGFFGFLGLILAVPIIVITMVLVQEVYIKDILGDTGERPGEAPVEETA
jgi:predicted PurR-regulated permease PerM